MKIINFFADDELLDIDDCLLLAIDMMMTNEQIHSKVRTALHVLLLHNYITHLYMIDREIKNTYKH